MITLTYFQGFRVLGGFFKDLCFVLILFFLIESTSNINLIFSIILKYNILR